MSYLVPGLLIRFRMMTDSWEDAFQVSHWRNTAESRAAFYNTQVVTPDTHREFIWDRKPHDLIFMIESVRDTFGNYSELPGGLNIGMLSVTVDVQDYSAEYGRLYIDPRYRKEGYGAKVEFGVLYYVFEELQLNRFWLEGMTEAAHKSHLKAGWRDIPNNPQRMEYTRADWERNREALAERLGLVAPWA